VSAVAVGDERANGIHAQVRAVLTQAVGAYGGHPEVCARLEAHLERLEGPLRIAIAGKVKAGKSTLLNALVGEIIAPTDAGECTRIVTWYRDDVSPRITMWPHDGEARELPIMRRDGKLQIDLQGMKPEDVERLTVDWPSRDLAPMTLIDTPGLASVSEDVSARTVAFLTPESPTGEGQQGAADAIIYLMRHVHADDVHFLESFHDQAALGSTPVNTVAVLSRADEIGAGRIDALLSARKIARRLRTDDKIRALAQTVVPVAGLLAETGRTLRQAEFGALQALALGPREYVDKMLLSADRFTRELTLEGAPEGVDALPSAVVRRDLVGRLGMFGIRIALPLIRQGSSDAPALAAELVRRSGLQELKDVLAALFTERGELLKARSALVALEAVLRETPVEAGEALLAEVERIMSGAHEFVELGLLGGLRAGVVVLPKDVMTEAERLLGGSGQQPWVRLGLESDASSAQLRTAAIEAMARWRRRAENPLSVRATAEAARVVVRTCEGLIAALPST
jgi:hypothetical protein